MIKPLFRWTLATALIVAAGAGCKKDTQQANGPESGEPGTVDDEPETSGDVETAEALWLEVEDYRDWPAHSNMPVPGQEPHGAYIHLFYNDVAKTAIGGEGAWPDGAIFVKDNFPSNEAGDGPGDLAAITIMKKSDGTWFWAKYKPDGALFETTEGAAVAGTEGLGCIDCHAGLEQRDHVITKVETGGEG